MQPRQFFKYLIWDNFRLVEVDANGDEVDGINLLADYDCDFEDAFSPAAKPADAYVSSLDGKNIVVVEASDSTDFHIYSKASDGQLTLLSLTALTDGSGGGGDWSAKNLYAFEHSGLTNGTKYTYVVKAVNEYGESEGIEISGTPKQGVGSYTNEVLNSFWTFQNNGKSYSTVTAKRGIGYNGTAGLRITRLGKITGNYSTTDLFYTSDYTTVEDQLYKLTYKQKISNGPVAGWYDSYGFIQTNGSLDGENFPTGITPTRTYNSSVDRADVWAEKTLYFRGNGNRFAFNARITQCVKYLIWDDFRLVTVDGELNETSGTNLLADSDCGFEDAFVQQITAEFGFYPADGDEFDYGARLDDEKINAFSAALEDYGTSTIRGEAEVKNIGYTEGVPAVLILAVYKDSYLYDVYSLTSNVPAIESAAEEGEILALAYTLPELLDDGVYSAKLMLLDGFGSLKPLVAGPAPEIGE